MRLDSIHIGEFKNLKNLDVDFDEKSPYTVLVGENGTGKSNLIEALALIFRNIDLDLGAPFKYELRYFCRKHHVEIRAEEGASPRVKVRFDGADEFVDVTKKRFMEVDEHQRPLYRPTFVFGYYSGPSDRLSGLFEQHTKQYYTWIIKPAEERRSQPVSNARRRLFYAQTLHGQFALLAFFMNKDIGAEDDRAFLKEHLQIDGLDSVLFCLKRPPWRRSGGDKRFWNAEGEVRDFLDRLYSAAVIPARMERRIPIDLGKNPSVECLYLFLPTAAALEEVCATYSSQYAFFTALESTYISKLLSEVRTRVRMTPAAGGGAVTYRDLSEGEQQLLLVLGLLKFTADDEALFLLDEPDTHLNPSWSTQYLDFLNRFIRGRETCHVVMSTHDPLVFSRLAKEQVRIFRRDVTGQVEVEEPLQDPRGMGVQAILTSDLFRLRSVLDPETQRDLDTQQKLSHKKGELNLEEEKELKQVNERLHGLDFWKSDRDPLFALFLKKWAKRENPEWNTSMELSADQIRNRDKLAEEIASEMAAEIATKKKDSAE